MYGDSSWEEQMLADQAAARRRQDLERRLAALEARLDDIEGLLEEQTAALARYHFERLIRTTARTDVA